MQQLGAAAAPVVAAATTPTPRPPNRRQRRGSTLRPVRFQPLDRNQRARLIFLAERYDAATRLPRQHGGDLKRSGLHVLKVLLFHFLSVANGRCDPSYEAIERESGVRHSTIAKALDRLEEAGIVTRVRRAREIRVDGRRRIVQWSNAYAFDLPKPYRLSEAAWYGAHKPSDSKFRQGTTDPKKLEAPAITPKPSTPTLGKNRPAKYEPGSLYELINRKVCDRME